jgi:alpha-tubulin suppressor-like RCC1 family protein
MHFPAGTRIKQVASGFANVVLLSDGTVWVTGRNQEGEAGNGTESAALTTPTKASISGVIEIATKKYTVYALKSDGTVWSWGYGVWGNLGNGTTSGSDLPVRVSGLSNVVHVTSEADDGLALLSDGTVWAWGDNSSGQLGNNTVCTPNSNCVGSKVPVQVHGPGNNGVFSGITEIAGGDLFALARKSDGTVWAWGSDNLGQAGDGGYSNKTTPIAVHAPGSSSALSGVVAVSAGGDHGMALQSGGTLVTWGYNADGEVGNGSAGGNVLPTAVLTQVTAMAGGDTHSLAVKSDGSVWAWGENSSGELGVGTIGGAHTSPTRVALQATAVAVAAGQESSILIAK